MGNFNILTPVIPNHIGGIAIGVIFILLIANFIGLFAYWIYQFNKTGSTKFSFTRYLPFELNRYRRDSKTGSLDMGWIILSLILLSLPVVVFALAFGYISSYIIMAFFIAEVIAFGFLCFVKLSNYKGHLVNLCIFAGFQIGFSLLAFWFFTKTKYGYSTSNAVTYVISAFIILQLIFQFVLILNPTYKGWAKMQKMDAGTFNRPKYCYIAMLEWGTFLNMLLNYIVILIVAFF